METAALIVATLSLLVAGFAAYISSPYSKREKRREARAEHAEQRARDAERRAEDAERRSEKAEAREADRYNRELAAERSSRSARPTSQLLSDDGTRFNFRVKNVGRSAWWDLKPSLVNADGDEVSEPFSTYLNPLSPGEHEEFSLSIKPGTTGLVYLRYEWGDEYRSKQDHVSRENILA